jgi:hypothetical protein
MVAVNLKLDAALVYAAVGISVFPCHSMRAGRCTCGGACGESAGKHPRTPNGHLAATTDASQIRAWWSDWPEANVGAAMKASGLIAFDIDPRHGGDEAWSALIREHGSIVADTWTNLTGGGGVHHIFRAPETLDYHGDAIAPGVDVKWSGYVLLPPSDHKEGRRYEWEIGAGPGDGPAAPLPAALLAELQKQGGHTDSERSGIAELLNQPCPEGQRNTTLARIAGYFRNELAQDVTEATCQAWNAAYCRPPLRAIEVTETVAGMYRRYQAPPKVEFGSATQEERPSLRPLRGWPEPLGEATYYGLAGRLVQVADPCTEADPAGVLLTFLTMVGNVMGRGPHLTFGTELHRCNLFIGLVGASGSGRKGTSLGPGRAVVGAADPEWGTDRNVNGLVSGEGVIYHVRDAQGTESGGAEAWDGRTVKTPKARDPGVADKRLNVIETELGGLLTAMHRQGSTLSHVLRAAWDGQKLQSLSKNAPVSATGAHISVIGHITPDELRTALTSVDAANGFGNRFLWGMVRRSKVLPRPPAFAGPAVDDLIAELQDAIDYGQAVGAMRLDAEAGDAYDAYYRALPDDPPGLAGVMAVRAPAFVLRLAMVYALLESSAVIRMQHLTAALEVVRFCLDSARAIFGEMTGDPLADRVLEALQAGALTRKQISVDVFSKNVPAAAIAKALQSLERAGLAYAMRTATSGRPAEVWSAW